MIAWSFRVVLVNLHSLACQRIRVASAGFGELLPEVQVGLILCAARTAALYCVSACALASVLVWPHAVLASCLLGPQSEGAVGLIHSL